MRCAPFRVGVSVRVWGRRRDCFREVKAQRSRAATFGVDGSGGEVEVEVEGSWWCLCVLGSEQRELRRTEF